MKQQKLALGKDYEARKEHGGSLRRGRRKLGRPVDPKRPLHLVLRSARAKDSWSMLRAKHEKPISELVHRYARKNGVRVYRYANSGNHLHLLVVGKRREGLANFLRTIGALIPRFVTGAKKGQPKGKFWDHLAYSRVVEWGRDFINTRLYVIQNEAEASGTAFVSERRIRPKPV